MLNPKFKQRITASGALDHAWLQKREHKDTKLIGKEILSRLKIQDVTNRLVKETMNVMIRYMKEDDIRQLNDIFRDLDTEHTGFITPAELQAGLKKAGITIDNGSVEEIIRNATFDESDKLDYTAFVSATLDRKLLHNKDSLWQAFKYFDIDNSGFITLENLKEVFSRRGEKLSKNDFKKIMKDYELGEKESISFEDFCKIFEKQEDVHELSRMHSSADENRV